MTGPYSRLKTPEAQLEYLLLFVCGSRSASSRAYSAMITVPSKAPSKRRAETQTHRESVNICTPETLTLPQLIASPPKIDGKSDRHDGQDRAKFNEPSCFTGVAGKRSEDVLNVQVVARVQECSHPETSRSQSHPSEDNRDRHNQNRETCQAIPRRRPAVVITPNKNGIVPASPTKPTQNGPPALHTQLWRPRVTCANPCGGQGVA